MPIRDTRLAEKALRQLWPIPVELRGKVIAKLSAVLDHPNVSPREVVSACRALIAANSANLEAIKTTLAIDPDTYSPRNVRQSKLADEHRLKTEAILAGLRGGAAGTSGSEERN
jgi:hypothetical protein